MPSEKTMLDIVVVLGSTSDLEHCFHDLKKINKHPRVKSLAVHVCSCHRNPEELRKLAKAGFGGSDLIFAVGGKAFALPGIICAWLDHFGFLETLVYGVAVGKSDENFPSVMPKSLKAAMLSIEELPGQPVRLGKDNDAFLSLEEAFQVALGRKHRPRQKANRPVHLMYDWEKEGAKLSK